MRKFILGAAAVLALMAPAAAADMPKGPVHKAQPAVFDWTGLYVGVDAGHLASRADQILAVTGARAAVDPDGLIGGAHIGYRRQAPGSRFVYGVEADIWGARASSEVGYTIVVNNAILDLNWGASLRGIVGVTMSPTLLYATGGVSLINISGCTTGAGVPGACFPRTQFKDDRVGWTIGVGLAHAVTPKLIARIEYLYADYGLETYATPGLLSGRTFVDLQTHTVRVGLNWRFTTR